MLPFARHKFATYLIAACAIFTGAAGNFPLQSAAAATPAVAAPGVTLAPFSQASEGVPPAPWRIEGLPSRNKPVSQFDIVTLDTRKVLRVRTDHSYGTLSHAVPPQTTGGLLHWQWRLDQPLARADLRHREGDDAALKVCALFDMPLEHLGLVERDMLLLTEHNSGEKLPSATLCYVWDRTLPVGTELPNPFTRLVHYIVLDSGTTPLQQWTSHTRDLGADFLHSFGQTNATVPPLMAIAVGADADNTGDSSLAYVGDITLMKQ